MKARALGRHTPGREGRPPQGVCFQIRRGDRPAIVSPAGSGTTVLLRVLVSPNPRRVIGAVLPSVGVLLIPSKRQPSIATDAGSPAPSPGGTRP